MLAPTPCIYNDLPTRRSVGLKRITLIGHVASVFDPLFAAFRPIKFCIILI